MQDLIQDTITKGLSDKIGTSLGVPSSQADSVISMLMPTLLGGLQKNAQDPTEAANIVQAAQKDHAGGGIFDNLESLIADPASQKGDGILKHILGDNRNTVESTIAQKSGMDSAMVSSIFTMIAPLVMGELGKKLTGSNTSTSTNQAGMTDMLTGLLGGGISSKAKEQSFLESLIDQDNDGNVADDILSMGMKFFTKA